MSTRTSRIKWWNIKVFGKINLELEEGVRVMNSLDELDSVYEDSLKDKKEASKMFWLNLKIKENMIIQRAKRKWLNDGDMNSKFFHMAMKKRLSHNHIGPISSSRGMLSTVIEVKSEVVDHFLGFFKECDSSRPFLEGEVFRRLDDNARCSLELPFLESEIKEAVCNCDGSKCLGPDGFSITFFKKCWSFIKFDVLACFRLSRRRFPLQIYYVIFLFFDS